MECEKTCHDNAGADAYDPDDSGEVSIHVVLGGVSKVEIDEKNVL